MSHVHCHSHSIVGQVYKSVVSDTIAAVRSFFLDEGVDEQVLQELKQLWESKLNQSRAVDLDKPEVAPPSKAAQRNAAAVAAAQRSAQQQAAAVTQAAAQSTTGATAVTTVQPQSLVPIQITIPPQTPGGESKTIVVQVPVSAVQSGLAGQHLQTILSSAAAQATFALPPEIASNMLQQQLNDALRQSTARVVAAPTAGGGVQYAGSVAPAPPQRLGQLDGCGDSPDTDSDTDTAAGGAGTACGGGAAELFLMSDDTHQQADAGQSSADSIGVAAAAAPDVIGGAVGGAASSARCCLDPRRRDDRRLARRLGIRLPRQLDGPGDTSDSDDDDDVDDVDDDVDDDEDLLGEDDEEDQGQEEEPLNSEDDVSDHEPADLTETFNVMVCQYDKITRSRNKWKFHLKDGIMNLDGKDYIFQKAGGDAEW